MLDLLNAGTTSSWAAAGRGRCPPPAPPAPGWLSTGSSSCCSTGWSVQGPTAAAALVFGVWTRASVWPLDPAGTAAHSQRDNPSRGLADALLLGAAGASLLAVGLVLFGASHAPWALKYLEAGFAVVSVLLAWVLVHTVHTLKYARLYYQGSPGGVSFYEVDPPQYSEFAYLSFAGGMTFQVSDTDLQNKAFRRTARQHAWIPFPLSTVIRSRSVLIPKHCASAGTGITSHCRGTASWIATGAPASTTRSATAPHENPLRPMVQTPRLPQPQARPAVAEDTDGEPN